jgi:hypothetical protein
LMYASQKFTGTLALRHTRNRKGPRGLQ